MNARSGATRILGIDPGLNRTGYGIVERDAGRLHTVACGVIRVPPGPLAQRLGHILSALAEVIRDTQPQLAVVEKVFVNVNPQSTLLLGQARGAALCAAVSAGLAVHEYTALQVKQAVVGYGHADKLQVQKMVQRLLGMARAPALDAADALACCICHAHSRPAPARLRPADPAPGPSAGSAAPGRSAPRGRRGSSREAWQRFAQERRPKDPQ